MNYSYREGARNTSVDAQAVGEELERIRSENDGKLLPQDVVEESRSEDAVLHPAFEWIDAVAAEEYRLNQARTLIRSVRVVTEAVDRPAYVSVRVEQQPYYQATEVAVQNVDEWASAVAGVMFKLQAAKSAVEDLERMAEGNVDRTAALIVAAEALRTANRLMAQLH